MAPTPTPTGDNDSTPFFSNIFGGGNNSSSGGDGGGGGGGGKGIVHKAEVAIGLKEEEPSAFDVVCDSCGCSKLPWKYRIGGFAACAGIGFILSLGSMARLSELVAGNPEPFVVMFTFGAIIALIGSMFLSTPKAYAKKACDKYHWGATTFYLFAIIMTLFCVYYTGIPADGRIGIIVLCLLIQYAAFFWFTLSMIPFVARIQQEFCRTRIKGCMYAVCPCLKPKEGIFG